MPAGWWPFGREPEIWFETGRRARRARERAKRTKRAR